MEEDPPVVSMHIMLNFHHAVFDGESITQLMGHIRRVCQEQKQNLPIVNQRCDDFFKYCDGGYWIAERDNVRYWLAHMSGWDPALITPSMPRTRMEEDGKWPEDGPKFTAATEKVRRMMSLNLSAEARSYCASHGVTPHGLYMSIYYLALWSIGSEKQKVTRCSASSSTPTSEGASDDLVEICIGSAMSNRVPSDSRPFNLDTALCSVADTYPYRIQFNAEKEIFSGEFLPRVMALVMDHLAHQSTSIAAIIVAIQFEAPTNQALVPKRLAPLLNPFFGTVLLYEDARHSQGMNDLPLNLPRADDEADAACEPSVRIDLELLDLPDFGAVFEIQMKVQEIRRDTAASSSNINPSSSTTSDVCYALTWEYASQLFAKDTIVEFSDIYVALLAQVLLSSNPSGDRRTLARLVSDARKSLGSKEVLDKLFPHGA